MLMEDTMRKVLGGGDWGCRNLLASPALAGMRAAGSTGAVLDIGSFKEQTRAHPEHARRGPESPAYHDERGSYDGFLPGVGPTESELRIGALLAGLTREVVGSLRKFAGN